MKYVINGGNKLFGKVKADLAKNAILPIIAATIMCDEVCVIRDIPMYLDVIEKFCMNLFIFFASVEMT